MPADLSLTQSLGLGGLVFFAGAVDAVAGGGGLITLPAYLAAGLSPSLLLGTNKLSSTLGTMASVRGYLRRLKFPLRPLLPVLAWAGLGAVLGARSALFLSPAAVRMLLLLALPGIAVAVLLQRDFGQEDRSSRLEPEVMRRRSSSIAAGIGAYDGFFGPGTGTFFALALTRWCGYDLLGATARAKLLNLVTNISALAVFLWSGRLDPALGLTMAAASALGHHFGARLGLQKGGRIIRPTVALVCAGLFLKLLRDTLAPR